MLDDEASRDNGSNGTATGREPGMENGGATMGLLTEEDAAVDDDVTTAAAAVCAANAAVKAGCR